MILSSCPYASHQVSVQADVWFGTFEEIQDHCHLGYQNETFSNSESPCLARF